VTSVARLMLSARYTGAVPLRDRKTRHDILKVSYLNICQIIDKSVLKRCLLPSCILTGDFCFIIAADYAKYACGIVICSIFITCIQTSKV